MINVISQINKKKLIFKAIKPHKILFLDNGYFQQKKKIRDSFTLHNDYVYIIPLIKAFLEIFFTRNDTKLRIIYFQKLIKSFKPKIIISNDFDHRIAEVKKINKKIKTLIYQHNSMFVKNSQINIIKNLKVRTYDYFFVYDEYSKKLFSKYIQAKYKVAGSLRYNEFKADTKPYKYDIMFISEYRSKKRKIPIFCQKKILEILNEYKRNNNVKICIALNSIRKEKKINLNEEKKFIKMHAPDIELENNDTGYSLAAKSKLIVFISSNLGVEILSSKKRVLGLFMKGNFRKKWKSDYISKKTNLFLNYTMNKKEIFKKINYLLKIKEKKWLKILKSSKINLKYDYKNKIFFKIIKKLS